MTTPSYDQYRALMKQGRYADAADLAEQAYHAGNPNNAFWLTRRAAALTRCGRYHRAQAVAKEAVQLAPRNPYALMAMGEACQGLLRFDEALTYFEAVTEDSKLALWARKGVLRCLAEQKAWDRLLECLASWELPREVMLQWKVKALESRGDTDAAIAACGEWLQEQPGSRAALWSLTELEIRRDGLQTVLDRMARMARIGSSPPIYKEVYASLCRRAGKPELAIEAYDSLARNDAEPRILRKKAFAMAKSGEESEAIPLLEELLALDPEDVYLHSSYLAACRRTHQLERALGCYQSLLEANPQARSLHGRIRVVKRQLDTP